MIPVDPIEMSNALPCLLDQFQLVALEDTDMALACCKAALSLVDSYPSRLLKLVEEIMIEKVAHQYISSGRPHAFLLKETILRPIPKKTNMVMDELSNYRPDTNFSILGNRVSHSPGHKYP